MSGRWCCGSVEASLHFGFPCRCRCPHAGESTNNSGPAAVVHGEQDSRETKAGDTMGDRTMKAMAYASYGGVEKLERLELPLPKVGPGTVRIKVKAAGVNPVD